MAYLLVLRGPLNLPSPTRRTWRRGIDTAGGFLHAAGVEVAALRALVVRLHGQHLDPLAASGADGALGVGIDGAGGQSRLGFDIAEVRIAGVGHDPSIPEPPVVDRAGNQRSRRARPARSKAIVANAAKSSSVPGPGRPPAAEQPLA